MATDANELTLLTDDDSASYQNRRVHLAQVSAGDELMQWAMRQGQARAAGRTESSPAAPAEPGAGGPAAVAKDVGRGAIELPRAVAGGLRDAAQNTVDIGADIGAWFEDTFQLGGLKIDANGIQLVSHAELKALREQGKDVASKIALPDIDDPKSTTGKMAKGVVQFVAGFLGAGKIKGLTGAASTTGRLAQAAGRGAVADFAVFDPHEERLSNLVQRFPKLRNPITEFLSAEKDDSALMGRFKNTLEGLGLGMLADGLGLSLKQIRNARLQRLQDAGRGTAEAAEDAVPALDPKVFDVLGDVEAPIVTRSGTAGAAKLRRAAAATGNATVPLDESTGDVFINFRRIETPEDVQATLQKVADAYKGDVDAARRGTRSFKEIELSADQEDAWSILMERRTGEPLNAEQSVAARKLWVSSGEKLTEVARLAAETPSEGNLFAFRKMLATHYAIQNEVIAARTETARALASWRIPVGGGKEMTRMLQHVLQETGGADMAREMAQRITALSNAGYARELDEFVRGSVWARSRDAMLEVWINSLLSGPKTHLVNMLSNTSVAFMQMYERATAARLGRLLGDGGVEVGEAMAQYHGLVSGLRDAWRFAWKNLKTGESSGLAGTKIDVPHKEAFTSEAFGISSSGWLGRAVDALGHNVVRLPGRFLQAEDEFFKTIGFRMELHAQALRTATQEVHSGAIRSDQLKARIADILANPPENVRIAAVDQALYQTFTNAPGKLAQKIQRGVAEYPVFRILLPFVRTPANILKFTFERTPLAPLMRHVRADLAAGGARRDLALARMGTGTAVLLTAADLAMNEQISGGGPVDAGQRQALARTGWQPYSVKVGDRWFAYNRLDPLGMTLGLSADMVEILSHREYAAEDSEADAALVAAVAAIGNNTMSKTYLSGLAEFFEAMSDPRRYSESYWQRFGGSLIPTGAAELARLQDPYMREAASFADALRRRTPGLSADLPIRRDLWGRPLTYRSGLGRGFDVLSPIYSRKENPEPIDQEILRLEMSLSMPRKKVSFDGATVDLEKYPGAYSRYVELAGNELKHPAWNLGAKDLLNEIITGKHPLSAVYQLRSDGPEGGKDVFIRDIVRQYQQMARRQLLTEYPEIADEVGVRQERRRAIRMPVLN